MANEVNNEVEESETGETSTVEQAPEQKQAEPAVTAAPEAQPEQAAPETTSEPAAAETKTETAAPPASNAPRTVAKPATMAETPASVTEPPAEEPQGGDIDFGAILEQFEQEQ